MWLKTSVSEFLSNLRSKGGLNTEKNEGNEEIKDGVFSENVSRVETFEELIEEQGCENSSSSEFLTSETTGYEDQNHSSSEESSSPPSLGWPVQKTYAHNCNGVDGNKNEEKPHLDDRKLEKQGSTLSEVEMMKERFAKLLLGEDMSGCGNGVSIALAISNAIANLYGM